MPHAWLENEHRVRTECGLPPNYIWNKGPPVGVGVAGRGPGTFSGSASLWLTSRRTVPATVPQAAHRMPIALFLRIFLATNKHAAITSPALDWWIKGWTAGWETCNWKGSLSSVLCSQPANANSAFLRLGQFLRLLSFPPLVNWLLLWSPSHSKSDLGVITMGAVYRYTTRLKTGRKT